MERSMSKPIEIAYVWNRENLDKLFETSYRYQFEHSHKRYIGWFFIALMQFGVVAALKKGAIELLLFSTVVLIYWYYGKKWIAKRRAVASFEQSPFRDQPIKMEVDASGFVLHSPKAERWSWEDIHAIIPLGEDIMLYKSPNIHYIPASAFASIEEKSRFKAMAKAKGKLA